MTEASDKRQHPRFRIQKSLTMRMRALGRDRRYEFTTVNISMGGLLLSGSHAEKIRPDQIYECELAAEEVIRFRVSLVRRTPNDEIGVKIDAIDKFNADYLQKLLGDP